MPGLSDVDAILGVTPQNPPSSQVSKIEESSPELSQVDTLLGLGGAQPEAKAAAPSQINFDTVLDSREEPSFAAWKEQHAPQDSGEDYDLRGAYKAGLTSGKDGHWPDTYKKPNHPTFSFESIYAKDAPDKAGRWQGETYIPAADLSDADMEAELARSESKRQASQPSPIVDQAVASLVDDHEFDPTAAALQSRQAGDEDGVEIAKQVWKARKAQGWKDKAGRVYKNAPAIMQGAVKGLKQFAQGLVQAVPHVAGQMMGNGGEAIQGGKLKEMAEVEATDEQRQRAASMGIPIQGIKAMEEGVTDDPSRTTKTAETLLAGQMGGVNAADYGAAIFGAGNQVEGYHKKALFSGGELDRQRADHYGRQINRYLKQERADRGGAGDPDINERITQRQHMQATEAILALRDGKELDADQAAILDQITYLTDQEEAPDKIKENETDREFDFDVEQLGKRQQILEGKPLEEGALAEWIKLRSGGDKISELYSPENLKAMGADPVDKETIESLSGVIDPVNVATLRMPFLVPGARNAGGAVVEAAGRTGQAIGSLGKLIPGGKLAAGGVASAAALSLANGNPELAMGMVGTALGAAALRKIGSMSKTMAEIGRSARTGGAKIATATTDLAKARLTGQSAKKAWIANLVGNTAVDMATMPIGMAPFNAITAGALPGGKEFNLEEFAAAEMGSPLFGALSIGNGIKPQLVEAIRPQLRQEGQARLEKNQTALGQRSQAYLASLPEAHRNAIYEMAALFEGAEGKNDKGDANEGNLYILGAADYAKVQQDLGLPQGGRGFAMKDGNVYVNGQHRSATGEGGAGEMAHTAGHEMGGHQALNILRAMTGKGGNLFEGLMKETRKELGREKSGVWTPTASFQKFVDAYNAKLPNGAKKLVAGDPHSLEEFLSETAGQVLARKGAADLVMPEGLRDKLANASGRFFGRLLGMDTREVGGPTHFDREESGAITSAYMDAMRRIADVRFRPQDADTQPDPGAMASQTPPPAPVPPRPAQATPPTPGAPQATPAPGAAQAAASANPAAPQPAPGAPATPAVPAAQATPAPQPGAGLAGMGDPFARVGLSQSVVDDARGNWVAPQGDDPRFRKLKDGQLKPRSDKEAEKIAKERGAEFDAALEEYRANLEAAGLQAPTNALELEQAILAHQLGAKPVNPAAKAQPQALGQMQAEQAPAAAPEAAPARPMAEMPAEPAPEPQAAPQEAPKGPSPEEIKARMLAAKAKANPEGKKTKGAAEAEMKAESDELVALATENAAPGELRRDVDDKGEAVWSGRINPENPIHRMILDRAGVTGEKQDKLQAIQDKLGKLVFVRKYGSAAKAVENEAEGMGFSQAQRAEEQAANSADARAQRQADPSKVTGETAQQDKSIIPLWQEVTSTGKVIISGLSPDKLVGNAKKILDFLAKEGDTDLPYRDINDPQLVEDVRAYALNHANGWKGDGSKEIAGEQANPNYQPVEIPKNRFDLINAALKREDATATSRYLEKSAAYDLAKVNADAKGKPFKGRKPQLSEMAVEKERAAQRAAIENMVPLAVSGEVNPLRERINNSGRFTVTEGGKTRRGTEEILETTFEQLRADLIEGGIEETASGQEGGLRGTDFKGDLSRMAEAGLPKGKHAAAGYMPEAEPRTPKYKTLWIDRSGKIKGALRQHAHDELLRDLPPGSVKSMLRARVHDNALHLEALRKDLTPSQLRIAKEFSQDHGLEIKTQDRGAFDAAYMPDEKLGGMLDLDAEGNEPTSKLSKNEDGKAGLSAMRSSIRPEQVEINGQKFTKHRDEASGKFVKGDQEASFMPDDLLETGETFAPRDAIKDFKESRAIKSAAIKMPDGEIIEGQVHGIALSRAQHDFDYSDADLRKSESGFVDGAGNFLDRDAARERGVAMGQIKRGVVDHHMERRGLSQMGLTGEAFRDTASFMPDDVEKPDRKYSLRDLPRDMREQLFNEHATFVDNEAVERDFYNKRVPSGWVSVENLKISKIPSDQLDSYRKASMGDFPPIVIADGKLLDGQHRIALARERGIKRLRYIDVSGLTDTDPIHGAGHISELPKGEARMMPDDDKNLAAVHNLSAGNLEHVLKMGGLAAPSLGVIRIDRSKFDGFGEITMVASKSLARDTKWFNTDIYSPRYPTTQIVLKHKEAQKITDHFKKYREELADVVPAGTYRWGADTIREAIEERGFKEVGYKTLAQYAYLRENGLLEKPGKDISEKDLEEKVYQAARHQTEQISKWVQEQVDNAGINYEDKIRDGYTNMGRPRLLPHTIDRVVKMLTKKIQDGEGFNYGVPSIRANVAKKYSGLEAMGKDREKIIPHDQMEPLKEETSQEFLALADQVNNLRESPLEGFRMMDAISDDFKAVAGGRDWAYLREQYGDNLNEATKLIRPFLDKLRHMPTEYFEGKTKREVKLQEFDAAIVPEGMSPKLIEALKKRGISVRTYPQGDQEARRAAVEAMARERQVNFMPDSEAVTIGGKEVKTGDPASFKFVRRTRSATGMMGKPEMDSPFDRGFEPSGRYMSELTREMDDYDTQRVKAGEMETGKVSFKNPLVIKDGNYGEKDSWKRALSQRFGGKTGKELSKAIIAAGHDGIITTFKGHPGEIVDLTTFDAKKAKYMPDDAAPFYSKLEKVAAEKIRGRATAEQIAATLRNNDVKQEELDWVLGDFLREKAGQKIAPEELQAQIQANKLEIQEVQKGEDPKKTEQFQARSKEINDRIAQINYDISEATDGEITTRDLVSDYSLADKLNDKAKKLWDERSELLSNRQDLEEAFHGSSKPTKFGQYQLPGGENYREFNFVLPQKTQMEALVAEYEGGGEWAVKYKESGKTMRKVRAENEEEAIEKAWNHPANTARIANEVRDNYKVPQAHAYGDKADINRLFHIRANDRQTSDGQAMLFAEEIQSDWHQTGRDKGYKSVKYKPLKWEKKPDGELVAGHGAFEFEINEVAPGRVLMITGGKNISKHTSIEEAKESAEVNFRKYNPDGLQRIKTDGDVPDAPFKGNAWKTLALKNLLAKAVAEGKSAIGWTTGAQQAERYDLSKQFESIELLRKSTDGTFTILGTQKGEEAAEQLASGISHDKLEDYVGKELASKVNPEEQRQEFSGVDLKVGGEGMAGFYDRELVNLANDLGKKYGAKVKRDSFIGESAENGSTWRIFQDREEASKWANENLGDHDFTVSKNDGGLGGYIVYDEYNHQWVKPEKSLEIWTMPITEKLKAAIQAGQALFMPDAGSPGDSGEIEGFLNRVDKLKGKTPPGVGSHIRMFFDPTGEALEKQFATPEGRAEAEEAFAPAREALRERFGDTLTLYRAESDPKGASGRNIFSYSFSKGIAKQHSRDTNAALPRPIKETKVPLDAVLWVENKGGEQEALVDQRKLNGSEDARIVNAKERAWRYPMLELTPDKQARFDAGKDIKEGSILYRKAEDGSVDYYLIRDGHPDHITGFETLQEAYESANELRRESNADRDASFMPDATALKGRQPKARKPGLGLGSMQLEDEEEKAGGLGKMR